MDLSFFKWNNSKEEIDKEELFNFEIQSIKPLSLIAIFWSFVSFITNLIIHVDFIIVVTPIFSILFFTLIYFMVRNNYHVKAAKWMFIIGIFVIVYITWRYNFGSRSIWFFIVIMLYSYLIFMLSQKQLIIITIILFITTAVLFYYEFNHPDLLGNYLSDKERIIDYYAAIFLMGISSLILMSMIKKSFLMQYNKAKTADRLKSAFLANMSHEIRTPLNSIVGFSNLLKDPTITDEEKEEYIKIISDSNKTLLQLIDDIIDVSMIDANQFKIKKTNFSINDLFRKLYTIYLPLIEQKRGKDVELKLKIPDKEYIIFSDPIRVQQVLVNLLNNAIKFTEKGSITMGFESKGDQIIFFVKDTGIGIDEENQKMLFERFYKVEKTKNKIYRGTGIGLYLSKKIVEMLEGEIYVVSTPDKGSEFYFVLPAKQLITQSGLENAKRKESPTMPEVKSETTVLLVEDDPHSLIYFKKIITKLNVNVLSAEDGEKAVDLYKNYDKISIVLLDIQLPMMNGYEVLKELRKIRPETPIVAQTAYAMEKDKKECLQAGFDDYIAKPISKEDLTSILNKYLH